MRVSVAVGVVAACIATAAMADDITASFWATEVAPPTGVDSDDHPCGSVVRVKTSVVPADAPWMRADTIREIDAAGKTYRSWRVPVDLYPVGIKDDTLVLAHGSDPMTFITVGPQGHLRIPKRSPTNWLQPTNCPGSLEGFGCVVIRENPVHYLVYPLVCS